MRQHEGLHVGDIIDSMCSLFFHMEFHSKFHQVSAIGTVKVRDLVVDTKYPILRAERVMTHLGHTIPLTIKNQTRYILKVFLPKRYARVITDTDIMFVNTNPEYYCLIYRGFDELTRYILDVAVL